MTEDTVSTIRKDTTRAQLEAMALRLDKDGKDWIFQRGIQDETVFNLRFNYFLINESILLAAFAPIQNLSTLPS